MTSFSPRSWLKWWRSAPRAARGRARRTTARLHLEPLEERQLLATFTVTNTNNAGPGSLRQAILSANSTGAADVIRFSVGQGPKDLVPTSPLPEIIHPVTLDGTTQPGYVGTPLITIGGGLAGPLANGLVLRSSNSTVRALTLRSFNGHGIAVVGHFNTIERCYIGIDPFQTFGAGNRDAGVAIEGEGNHLRGNVISGNGKSGVVIVGHRADGNFVQGNRIGTNAAGTAAVPNQEDGVRVDTGARLNTIGGSTAESGNQISGNRGNGVLLRTRNNSVQGNSIGTNAAQTAAIPNEHSGVEIRGASNNLIGGVKRNLIAGNVMRGVSLTGSGTSGNRVLGNFIGHTDSGLPLGNYDGVHVAEGANGNFIGLGIPGGGNSIVGNYRHGVVLWGAGTSGNDVWGNYIGSNADSGVVIGNGASDNVIGGLATGELNVIAFNDINGIRTVAAGWGNLLRGNALSGNGGLGIDIDSDGVTVAHTVSLTAASTSGTDTTVEGWLLGAPNATYTVELFASAASDPSGFGEGETPLPGLYMVSTDAAGYGYLLATVPFPLTVGSCVSATATESDGTTWEFGNCLAVVPVAESLGAVGGDAARALSPAGALPPPLSLPTSAPDAARALLQAESFRSAPPALSHSHERPLAEGPTLGADGAPFRHHRPDGAVVDAFFGGEEALSSEAPPHGTVAVLLGDDDCLSWEQMFVFDES